MPVYLSQTLLDGLIDQTDSFLNKAVGEWQMVPNHKFSNKPAPDKWSATQCLMHLNSYGRYYIPAIEKAISYAIQQNQKPVMYFKAGWLGNYFTEMMLPKKDGLPAKKMASPKDHLPQTNENSYEVIAEFIEQQEKFLVLLRKAKHINLAKTKVPISIAKFIKLQLGDTFLFLVAHNYRHILQAMRALKHSGLEQKELDSFLLDELSGATAVK
ncbi:MAG: DinB family protein [Bacteroidota bacterium]